MNKFRFYFILFFTTIAFFSCSKNDDSPDAEPPRDYAVQYATDIADIEEYLKTNYITVVEHPGFQDDQDVTFTKIPSGGTQPSIYSYLNSATYPKLLSRDVSQNDITYKLYYLVLREGSGKSPCNVDGVFTAYRGDYMSRVTEGTTSNLKTTKFEEVKFPSQVLSLVSVIKGWSEAFPKFKTGTSVSNSDGSVTNNNFGSGVLFIPSGLAYYASGSGSIPAYAPLIFSIKLYDINRLDQDSDQVYSYQEDLNNDGYLYFLAKGVVNPDDADGDEIPDFADVDDDNDNYTTKLEITKPTGAAGLSKYYPFNPVLDDPSTPTVDESEPMGIPNCAGNGITVPRLRKHLDKTCH